MTCTHDPFYTNDGRCMKCYPPKRAVMVKHEDGTVEIEREWIVNPAHTLDNLPAETKKLIEMTRRIWRDAKPIEY